MINHPSRRLAALYRAWVAADKVWVAEIEAAYPKEWPGDVRYITKGKGEPGTPLRTAYDTCAALEMAFNDAGGREWLMGRNGVNHKDGNPLNNSIDNLEIVKAP